MYKLYEISKFSLNIYDTNGFWIYIAARSLRRLQFVHIIIHLISGGLFRFNIATVKCIQATFKYAFVKKRNFSENMVKSGLYLYLQAFFRKQLSCETERFIFLESTLNIYLHSYNSTSRAKYGKVIFKLSTRKGTAEADGNRRYTCNYSLLL